MREIRADLFTYSEPNCKILRCVTTNGVVKKNSELTMGAGVALQANKKFPGLARTLGKLVTELGNNVYVIEQLNIASFPTKHDWRYNSDIELIQKSCNQLVEVSKDYDLVLLTRPGCGLGNLNWTQVKTVIEPILKDDKFVICNE